ncbi:hypothetical protein BC332_20419 [Capsicum chinense]|nr:hypothetical protein BC332_20419 [Capsicum chinense]
MKMLKILLVVFCILGCFSWPSMQSDLEMYIVQVESPESQISTQLSRIDSENWYKSFFPNTIATAGSEEEPRLIYSYHNVMKGFAARLSVGEVKEMAKKPGFRSARRQKILPPQIFLDCNRTRACGEIPTMGKVLIRVTYGWNGLSEVLIQVKWPP